MQPELTTEQVPKSSKVGLPFWLPVVISAVPFTLLVWRFINSLEPQPWWKFFLAIPIGLLPALVLSLIIQTVWDIVKATAHGALVFKDFLFMICLVIICAGFGWVLWILPEPWGNNITMEFFMVVLIPLIAFYIRNRYTQLRKEALHNKPIERTR